MKVSTFCAATDFRELQDAAQTAEAQGFDAFAVPEITGDPFMHLAAASMGTKTILLRTAIAVAFPRSPMITAGCAWALHANTGGRFALGLGTQVKPHNERRFSVTWDKPRQRMQEYVESLHAIWRSWEKKEKLAYKGDHYRFSLMTPEFSPQPSGLPRIPVYIAAVKPGMQQSVASYADGVVLHLFCTRKYLEEVTLPAIQAGLNESGRDRKHFEICGGGFIATGPDEAAVLKQREWCRYRIAFYGSTPGYLPVMSLHGWDDLAAKLLAMTRAGQWEQMAAEIPDDILDHFCVSAVWDNLPEAISQRFGGVSDSVDFSLAGAEPDRAKEILARVHAIPNAFTACLQDW